MRFGWFNSNSAKNMFFMWKIHINYNTHTHIYIFFALAFQQITATLLLNGSNCDN